MHFQPQMNTTPQGGLSCASAIHRHERRCKKYSKLRLSPVFIGAYLWLIACFFPVFSHAQETITVAVASSLYPTIQRNVQTFERKHDVKIRLISGSTGRLYNQIIQGAPFDVFIAADDVRPAMLLKQGKAFAKHTVGQGYLGLIIHDALVNDATLLMKANIQHIAIANPDVAPFGLATKKVLQKQGLWGALKSKFVYAQNALQAQMLVQKGLVDAGFVPIRDKKKALAEVPYVAVLLSDTVIARSFYNTMIVQRSVIPAVIPAKAGTGIHASQKNILFIDSRLRGNDGK